MVNPDSIRLAIHGQPFIKEAEGLVWAIAKIAVSSLFIAGHDTVILDATNQTRGRRNNWVSKEWKTLFKVIDTDMAECVDRAIKGGRNDLSLIIVDMAERYEPLDEDEEEFTG
jgi:predicted kinase